MQESPRKNTTLTSRFLGDFRKNGSVRKAYERLTVLIKIAKKMA